MPIETFMPVFTVTPVEKSSGNVSAMPVKKTMKNASAMPPRRGRPRLARDENNNIIRTKKS